MFIVTRVQKNCGILYGYSGLEINHQIVSAQGRPSGLPKLIYCARDSEILYERTLLISLFYACRIYFFLKNLENILF
jgi:hypothetical protein